MLTGLEFASIEQHHPAANRWEGVIEFKVVEDGAFGDDVFKQCPQVGDVPLTITQFINETALGLYGRNVECLVKRAIGGLDAQCSIQYQQGFAHRIDDVLGVILNIVDKRFSFHYGSLSTCLTLKTRAAL